MMNCACSNEKINKKFTYEIKSIHNCESSKVISRQNVLNVSCLLLIIYDEMQEARDALRRELLSF